MPRRVAKDGYDDVILQFQQIFLRQGAFYPLMAHKYVELGATLNGFLPQ